MSWFSWTFRARGGLLGEKRPRARALPHPFLVGPRGQARCSPEDSQQKGDGPAYSQDGELAPEQLSTGLEGVPAS